MSQVGSILVNGDKVTMSINAPAKFLPPIPLPVGTLAAHSLGAGQDFVTIGDDLICVDGTETSAGTNAKYTNPPLYVIPGGVSLGVKSGAIAKSSHVFIDGKAVLWFDDHSIGIDVQVEKGQEAKAPPQPPAPPQIDQSPHGGSGNIASLRQSFVSVSNGG